MASSMESSSGASQVEGGVSQTPRITTPSPIYRYSDYQIRSRYFFVFFDVPDPNLRYGIVTKDNIESDVPFFVEGDIVSVKFGSTSLPGTILKMSENVEYLYRKYAKFVQSHEAFLVHREVRRLYQKAGYPTDILMELVKHRSRVRPPTRQVMARLTFDNVEADRDLCLQQQLKLKNKLRLTFDNV